MVWSPLIHLFENDLPLRAIYRLFKDVPSGLKQTRRISVVQAVKEMQLMTKCTFRHINHLRIAAVARINGQQEYAQLNYIRHRRKAMS